MTKLIYSLEKRADIHNCYMLSGERAIFFQQEVLNYTDQKWIGFNLSNDYFNEKPATNVLGTSYIYFPGTAYNLMFAMRRKEEKNE